MSPLAQAFMDWLAKTPGRLAEFTQIAKQFYADQGVVELPSVLPNEPHVWKAGDTVAITTKPLTDEQIDALNKGFAEAVVKEKAIEFVKGFIMGVSLAA